MAKHPRHDRDNDRDDNVHSDERDHSDDRVLNKEDRAYAADAPMAEDRSLLPRDGSVPTDPYTPMTPPAVPLNAPVLRDAEAVAAEEVAALYAKFKPEAADSYLTFFLARTPAEHQEAMKATIAADLETPPGAAAPDPNVATVSGGQSIAVVAADGTTAAAGSPGTARVADGALTDVQLSV